MDETFSHSARRAMLAATEWAARLAASEIDCRHLLLAIVEESESRGATILAAHGVTSAIVRSGLGVPDDAAIKRVNAAAAIAISAELRRVLSSARTRALERGPDCPAGTDELLLELLAASPELRELLVTARIDVAAIMHNLDREIAPSHAPITPEFERLEIADRSDAVDVYRIVDAAANRAREGLRVLEDFARFACDDPLVTAELKALRHQLRTALERLPRHELFAARETQHDVGTAVSTPDEWSRGNALDVAAANFKRVEEALRSLEEFSKLECRPLAEAIEAARYRLYTLERATFIGADSRARLAGVVLYVLVSTDACLGGLEWTVREVLAGGAQAIQLREKSLPDREFVALARRVRRWTRDAGALFIVNDRPDLARLADADGVHVGQDDLSVKDARRIIGPRALVGVSTHCIEQARAAVLDGANYIGVGPTFPSRTKSFDGFPGLELLRQVHAEIRLPAFAIGGVTLERLDSLLAAGACRTAVSSAVCAAESPRAAAMELSQRLSNGPIQAPK